MLIQWILKYTFNNPSQYSIRTGKNILYFSPSYTGPIDFIIDSIDKKLHLGKWPPMKINKIIHGNIFGVTGTKSISASVRLTFDYLTNANICFTPQPLTSHGLRTSIPSTLIYRHGVIRLEPSISEQEFHEAYVYICFMWILT